MRSRKEKKERNMQTTSMKGEKSCLRRKRTSLGRKTDFGKGKGLLQRRL